jgi:hypothetical protein
LVLFQAGFLSRIGFGGEFWLMDMGIKSFGYWVRDR